MRYDELRPMMRTGDAILWEGSGLLSWLIRRWSKYSHASLIVRMERYGDLRDTVFLVEALATGLELRRLSQRLEGYAGKAFWFQPSDLTTWQRDMIRSEALKACGAGIGYDYKSLFRNILGHVSMNARSYFCSEFVWDMWVRVKALFTYGQENRAPRPGDIESWVAGRTEEIEA